MKKLLLIAFLSTAIAAGCSKKNDPDPGDKGTTTVTPPASEEKSPTACFKTSEFETNPTYVAGTEITFINCSVDGDTYKWEFGDGDSSNLKEPKHTFNAEGTFEVKLTAYSPKKTKTDAKTIQFVITPVVTEEKTPTACFKTFEFATNPAYVAGTEIEFENCSQNGDTYLWEFGDGSTSNLKDPKHTFKAIGTYEVKLTAYSLNKTKTDIKTMQFLIGEKYINKIVMTKFSMLTPKTLPANLANKPWDADGTAPDWAFTCSPGNQFNFQHAQKRTTVVKENMSAAPVEWYTGYVGNNNLSIENINWKITNEPWSYYITEVDGNTFKMYPGLGFLNINLYDERFNPIVLENEEYKVEIHWIIKN